MVASGCPTTDWQHLRTAVVSVCDNCLSGHCRSAHHGVRDFFGRFKRNSRYRGSASAEKRTERAGSLSGRDNAGKKLNQFRTKWLMKVIGKTATHFFVISRCKRRGDRARIRTVFHRSNARNLRRQDSSRFRCLNLKVGNEKNEVQARRNVEALNTSAKERRLGQPSKQDGWEAVTPCNGEAAEGGRCSVIRMSFRFGA